MEVSKKVKLDAIIEQAIDEFGLQQVVASVADMCAVKSAHVQENWQDQPLAGWWARRSALIEGTARKIGMENT